MKQLSAFVQKEFLELFRSKRIYVFLLLFLVCGIMNPAIAKMTPWLMENMSENLAEAGLLVADLKTDALTSWTQYFKNMPILFLFFLLFFGSSFTGEYEKGTLVLILAKGMKRWKIVFAKGLVMLLLWTAGNLIYFGVTYGYNAWFWDNSIASHVWFAAFCEYLAGVWLLSLLVLVSVFGRTGGTVLIGVGILFLSVYAADILIKGSDWLPTGLLGATEFVGAEAFPVAYVKSCVGAGLLFFLNFGAAMVCFNKKKF